MTLAFVAVLVIVLDPPRPTATAGADREPLPRRRVPDPGARRLGAARGAAVPGVDLLADLAGAGAALVRGGRRRPGRRHPRARRPRPDRGRATSPTWSARACARCAGWRSRPRVTMALLGLTEPLAVAVVLLVVASTVTVADNGLAFTSVAERAGSYWSGRALGVQNTAQYLAAAAVAPLAGLAISEWGYAATFGLSALCPVLALRPGPAPRRAQRRQRPRRRRVTDRPAPLVARLTPQQRTPMRRLTARSGTPHSSRPADASSPPSRVSAARRARRRRCSRSGRCPGPPGATPTATRRPTPPRPAPSVGRPGAGTVYLADGTHVHPNGPSATGRTTTTTRRPRTRSRVARPVTDSDTADPTTPAQARAAAGAAAAQRDRDRAEAVQRAR